jgi:hypothetical protein
VTRAAFYKVAFYRAGRRVFARRTSGPQLPLPTLAPGEYRFRVWPIYRSKAGRRKGKPIVQATFTLPLQN